MERHLFWYKFTSCGQTQDWCIPNVNMQVYKSKEIASVYVTVNIFMVLLYPVWNHPDMNHRTTQTVNKDNNLKCSKVMDVSINNVWMRSRPVSIGAIHTHKHLWVTYEKGWQPLLVWLKSKVRMHKRVKPGLKLNLV